MSAKRGLVVLAVLTVAVFGFCSAANAQFGFGKKKEGDKAKVDVGQVLNQGNDLIGYITIATDQGMKAVETITDMFPADKVANLKKMAAQYNELKAKRKDGNLDAEQFDLASNTAAEASKLDAEWQSYQKDKAQGVGKADSRLGLMLLADAQAGTKVPTTLEALQGALTSIERNPLQMGKAGHLKKQIAVLTAVSKNLPSQVTSYKTVRKLTKSIADAEKVKLPADPSPDQVKDRAVLESSAKAID